MSEIRKNVTVLLVEDNEIDVMGVQRAFRQLEFPVPIVVASDGIQAFSLLRDGKSVPKPYIILLDLNMPRMNGIEFLDELRRDESLGQSIVFVLTTSKDPYDLEKAYRRNIAGYIVKGGRSTGVGHVAKLLDCYVKTCEIPDGL